MSEHLSQIQLAGYGRRTLDADELLAVDRHLASCDDCYQRFTNLLPTVLAESRPAHVPSSESIEEAFHLDHDKHLVAYVDGTSNDIDREIIQSHIALCADCAEDLRDLQEFRQQPVWTATAKPLPRRDWMAQWQWPRFLTPQLTALAIVVLLLGITAAVVLWTTQRSRPVEQAGPPSAPDVDKNKESSPSGPEGNNGEKVATQPSPQPQEDRTDQPKPQREQTLIALNDGGGQVTLDQSGHLAGLQSLPPGLKKNIEEVPGES